MARVTSALTAFLLLVSIRTSKEFEIEDIVPGHEVAAQIGEKLVLQCRTRGCKSPDFSWRTQLDSPLGGVASRQGNSSVLTIKSVGFENENNYLCNAFCGHEKREKRVKVDIYSFPSDPIIKINSPLVLGKPAKITCIVPEVYPSDRLEVSLKKEEKIVHQKDFFEEPALWSPQTKNVDIIFTPTEEDIGKKIACIAELPIEKMKFEPKQRQTVHLLDIHYGPRNTHITASPGNTLFEGETLTLSCATESHPPAKVVWKKQLANETVQFIGEHYNLSIPNAQFSELGIYICEVTNEVTKEVEKRMVSISVQGAPKHLNFSIHPATTVQEGESVTLQCSAESNPAASIIIRRKSANKDVILDSQDGFVHISRVTPDDAGDYECEVKNEFGGSKMSGTLSVEYGPRNTTVSVTPSNTVKKGEAVTMICSTYGKPTPNVSWRKQLANGDLQLISEDATLTIENVEAEDMGHYHCEGVNWVGKDNKAVELIVEVISPTTPALTDWPGSVTEVEVATHQEAVDKEDQMENETTKIDTITFVKNVIDNIGNGTEDNKTTIAKMEEPDYVIPVIIVVSCLATAAGPMAAILIYISRKAKINGFYSLVRSMKPKV
ncbi:vascular cell adhesion protein 1 [Elgaria multicarinata webbii]|uniref:vascular cell adhesion protein 1 n=1 Tax=Elgaria multicarinata webbii TaxID=159646 RepID=UPI002FCD12D5